jgi:hypothetical protein
MSDTTPQKATKNTGRNIIIAVVGAAALLGVGLYFVFKRDKAEEEEEECDMICAPGRIEMPDNADICIPKQPAQVGNLTGLERFFNGNGWTEIRPDLLRLSGDTSWTEDPPRAFWTLPTVPTGPLRLNINAIFPSREGALGVLATVYIDLYHSSYAQITVSENGVRVYGQSFTNPAEPETAELFDETRPIASLADPDFPGSSCSNASAPVVDYLRMELTIDCVPSSSGIDINIRIGGSLVAQFPLAIRNSLPGQFSYDQAIEAHIFFDEPENVPVLADVGIQELLA